MADEEPLRQREWVLTGPGGEQIKAEFGRPITRQDAYYSKGWPLPQAPAEKGVEALRAVSQPPEPLVPPAPPLGAEGDPRARLYPRSLGMDPSEALSLVGLLAATRVPGARMGLGLLSRLLGAAGGAEVGGAIEGKPFGEATKETVPGVVLGEGLGGGISLGGKLVQSGGRAVRRIGEGLAATYGEQIRKLVPPLAPLLPKGKVSGHDLYALTTGPGDEALIARVGQTVQTIERAVPGAQFQLPSGTGGPPTPVTFKQFHDEIRRVGEVAFHGTPGIEIGLPLSRSQAKARWQELVDEATNQLGPTLGPVYKQAKHEMALGLLLLEAVRKEAGTVTATAKGRELIPRAFQERLGDPDLIKGMRALLRHDPGALRAFQGAMWGGGRPGAAIQPGKGIRSLVHGIVTGQGATGYIGAPAGLGSIFTQMPGPSPGAYRLGPEVRALLDALGMAGTSSLTRSREPEGVPAQFP